jgi:hypothetical protein
MNSTSAIFSRLAAVAPSLATWNNAPAIFNETAPDDFLDQEPKPTKPFLIIAVPTSDVAMETFTENGRLIVQDVRGYQRRTGSAAGWATRSGVAAGARTRGPGRAGSLTNPVRLGRAVS